MEFCTTGAEDIHGNKYVKGDDGRYYKTDGKTVWETAETTRLREQDEQRGKKRKKKHRVKQQQAQEDRQHGTKQ